MRLTLASVAACAIVVPAANAGDGPISLGINYRSTDAFVWVTDGETEYLDARGDELDWYDTQDVGPWNSDSEVAVDPAQTGFAFARAIQLSSVNDERLLVFCFARLHSVTNPPWSLVASATDSRFEGRIRVHAPVRVRATLAYQVGFSALNSGVVRLETADDDAIPIVEGVLDTGDEGDVFPLTLPPGSYWLEVQAGVQSGATLGSVGGEVVTAIAFDPSESCSAADIAEPFGTLNISDALAFIAAFAEEGNAADLAWPPQTLDLSDVLAFLDLFAEGCP